MTPDERRVIQSVYSDLQEYLDEPKHLDVGEELLSISRRLHNLLMAPKPAEPVLRWGELLEMDGKEKT